MFSRLKPTAPNTGSVPTTTDLARQVTTTATNTSATAPTTTTTDTARMVIAPTVHIHESECELVLNVDMPGVPSAAVDIRVLGEVLTISGKNQAFETVIDRTHLVAQRHEFIPCDYQRSFRLGHAIDAEAITAQSKDGVVRVTLPKRQSSQPRQIAVAAG